MSVPIGMGGPIVIGAGGTGGHMFPAAALAQVLRDRGRTVVLMTDSRTEDRARSLFPDSEIYVLPSAGVAGRGLVRSGLALGSLMRGTFAARRIFRKIKPSAVVGFGGYPSVPPVLASRFVNPRPLIILHEQNAVLGRANRRLARRADVLALSFEHTQSIPEGTTSVLTGNPVRPEIAARQGASYEPPHFGPIRLLVLGGSLGAKIFSDVVPAALAKLPHDVRSRLIVTQQAREDGAAAVRDFYRQEMIEAEVAPFFNDVASLLTNAHLVISRSGASSIAELAAIGRPSLLVPLPAAIDDHQTENCRALVEHQGAIWMPQPMFTAALLAQVLGHFFAEPFRLAAMARDAQKLARPHAAADLADLIERQLHQRAAA